MMSSHVTHLPSIASISVQPLFEIFRFESPNETSPSETLQFEPSKKNPLNPFYMHLPSLNLLLLTFLPLISN